MIPVPAARTTPVEFSSVSRFVVLVMKAFPPPPPAVRLAFTVRTYVCVLTKPVFAHLTMNVLRAGTVPKLKAPVVPSLAGPGALVVPISW